MWAFVSCNKAMHDQHDFRATFFWAKSTPFWTENQTYWLQIFAHFTIKLTGNHYKSAPSKKENTLQIVCAPLLWLPDILCNETVFCPALFAALRFATAHLLTLILSAFRALCLGGRALRPQNVVASSLTARSSVCLPGPARPPEGPRRSRSESQRLFKASGEYILSLRAENKLSTRAPLGWP